MANEKRLIDANALLEKLKKTSRYFTVKFDIEEAPTVDAVEVVRCKDCISHKLNGRCALLDIVMGGNDFCSYGERREGE